MEKSYQFLTMIWDILISSLTYIILFYNCLNLFTVYFYVIEVNLMLNNLEK